MNRSILIVICDFLLLSLLAFSTVDVNKVADQSATAGLSSTAPPPPADPVKDLTAVMRLALDEEKKAQNQLKGEVTRAQEEAARNQASATRNEQQALAAEQKAQTLARRAQTLDEQVQTAEQKAIALRTELSAREREVQSLAEKNQAFAQQTHELEQKAQVLSVQAQSLSEKSQASDEKARAAELKTIALQQELQARDRQVAALDEKTQASEQRANTLAQELDAKNRQIKNLDEKTRASEQRAGALQKELEARDQVVQLFKDELQSREQQALKMEQDRTTLQQQFAATQTNAALLTEELRQGRAEGVLSREKVSALEEQVRHQLEQSLALQRQLTDLARSNQAVEVEKERLAGQLHVAESEKRNATAQVVRMQEEVKAEREERGRLADNIKTLAAKSGEIAQAVREARVLAPNAIFSEFVTNRVNTQILAVRAGTFGGEASKARETQTVLVTDGTNTYALCHVQETPLVLWQPGVDWDGLTGSLSRNAASMPIRSLSFAAVDPRIVLIPVSADEARRLACRVYPVCNDPFKFQDAVLVGTHDSYYGQCGFQVDLSTPDYAKLDHNLLKGLFGKFNPSKGDLVFSRGGELIGVMANSTYCLILHNFAPEATFKFGNDGRGQRTGPILAALYAEVSDLPSKLQ